MSLSVYLVGELKKVECVCNCGNKHLKEKEEEYYWSNITHNLGEMAEQADIYYHLWRPGEIEITKAKELIEPLTEGIEKLKDKPEFFKKFNSSNGWGMYEHFVPWVEKYLKACKEYPDANIRVSR